MGAKQIRVITEKATYLITIQTRTLRRDKILSVWWQDAKKPQEGFQPLSQHKSILGCYFEPRYPLPPGEYPLDRLEEIQKNTKMLFKQGKRLVTLNLRMNQVIIGYPIRVEQF